MVSKKNIFLPLCVLLIMVVPALGQYQYDPDDFAVQVIDYHPGNSGHTNDWLSGDPYTDTSTALGRPTVDTCGDDWDIPLEDPVPLNPVCAAFRYYEICTVGYDSHTEGTQTIYDGTGYLELKFGRKVFDNPLNPFGCDLIVFGNAIQTIGGQQGWTNGDPNDTSVGANVFNEPGAVLVSQDGANWYRLPDPGETARGMDDFAPTLGRVYDPDNPDTSISTEYWENQWWGHSTNPTYPVNPDVEPADWNGMTVAEASATYKGSAGGAGLDLQDLDSGDYNQLATDPETGMKWIQYVRIENPKDEYGEYYGVSTEVDAVSDVFARLGGDANLDGVVNVSDLGILATHYGQTVGVDWWENGDFNGDGVVNVSDLGILATNYGLDNNEYNLGGTSSPPGQVPEPGCLLIVGLTGLSLLRRKRV